MKLLLLVVCIGAVLAAPADKKKRDILPGDPRYGTENHHENQNHEQQQHHEQENEVQPKSSYGPPNHTPGTPLGADLFAPGELEKAIEKASVLVPSTSYGIPDTTQFFNNFLGTIDDKKPELIKTTIQEEPKFDTVHVQKSSVIPEVHHEVVQPVVLQKHVENIPHSVSLPQVKVTASNVPTETQGLLRTHNIPSFTSSIGSFPSFASYPVTSYSNIPVKTVDQHVHVQVPHPYHVPVTKQVAVPVPVPHTVTVPKPYYVRVPQPVQVTVDRPYPVEVPRPVPYPVSQYVKTHVPHPTFAHHHVTLDAKANPLQTFFDNTQTSYQNVLTGLPTFSNPLETFGIQNPFEHLDLSSFPFIPQLSLPSFIPQPGGSPAPVSLLSSTNGDSITIDNPTLKTDTTITKPVVQPIAITHHQTKTHTPQTYKPATACAGCTVTSASSSKQEYVQPIAANGGYAY